MTKVMTKAYKRSGLMPWSVKEPPSGCNVVRRSLQIARLEFSMPQHDLSAIPSNLPAVLWVEPSLDLLRNKLLFEKRSSYSVTTASSHREVFDLRGGAAVAIAVLSDALGSLMLGAVARCVRSQWPSARIVLLKRKQPVLEDHLYDEDLDYGLLPKKLDGTLARLFNPLLKQRLLN
jgi:hypothetical protein